MNKETHPRRPNCKSARPPYTRIRSVRTLFLLLITGVSLFLALVLLWAGTNIMNSVISGFSREIMLEKLNTLIHQVDSRYDQTVEAGSSGQNLQGRGGDRTNSIQYLSSFRFKNSGSVFVIGRDQRVILSRDFQSRAAPGFSDFFTALEKGSEVIEYSAAQQKRIAVFRFYAPWQSYIGLTVDRAELFAPKDQFVRISLLLVTALFLATILFSGFIQRLIISPLIRLTRYANQVSQGNYDTEPVGGFHLELGALKNDIQQMVTIMRRKMDQTRAQLQIIREREVWLDKALDALHESEKKYRTIYNAPTEAILIYDPREQCIIDANKAMLGMFGLHHDDLYEVGFGTLGAEYEEFSRQALEDKIRATLETGPQLFEWMMQTSDGELFWGEISLQSSVIGAAVHIIAVIRNIHTRKTAQQELAAEKELLAVTLRSIADGIITTDNRGHIVLMNTVAEKLTGWSQGEAAGRRFDEVFQLQHPGQNTDHSDLADRILEGSRQIVRDEETVLRAKDGRLLNVAASGAPIRDPEDRMIGTVIVFSDITEEKRTKEELFKIKKLESVGILAGGIAHDFNNILVAILGNLSLARRSLDNPQEAESLLRNTEKAAIRAKDLTNQLLTFSKGGEPVIQTASIRSLIRESAEFVLRGSNVRVSFDIPDDLWLVNVDTGQISQVIQNIVLNASQAMPEGGEVLISCQNCSNCGPGPASLDSKCVRIIIRDTGTGIAEDILPRIFDPYFTTRSDGSGLGLAICHTIVKKHQGYIGVESIRGEGTTFTIRLPVADEQQRQQPETLPRYREHEKQARILVMDDDAMILDLTTRMLTHLGHEVVTCTDGRACLELYGRAMAENPFDLVIMDLTIPGGMGGGKAIRELLKLDPKARAIVSSGYSNDQVMAEYAEHGFKAVLVKPYQMEDLDQVVRKTLKR